MIAIPVSLIGTFRSLLLFGQSANTISLFAMVLSIGIVVDDAIVVVENVERVMEEEGLPPREAARKAMAQITPAIIAITLVLLSVFIPVGFIPGITGSLYAQFALTVSVAMLLSAVNALTLSPALCALMLRPRQRSRGPMAWVSRRIDAVRNGYVAMVARLIRVSALSLVVVALALAGYWGLSRIVPGGFLPEEDQGALFMEVKLPANASLNRTQRVMEQVRLLV